jgi:hypothetical protein
LSYHTQLPGLDSNFTNHENAKGVSRCFEWQIRFSREPHVVFASLRAHATGPRARTQSEKATQELVSITNQQEGTAAQSTLCNSVRVCNISRMATPTRSLAISTRGVVKFQPEHQKRCRGQQITRATHTKHAIYLPTGKINDNVSAHFIRPAGNIIGPLGAPLPQYRLWAVG